MGTFLLEWRWAVDQRQQCIWFYPGRWHERHGFVDYTGYLWKMDDRRLPLWRASFHEDLHLTPPLPHQTLAVETSSASRWRQHWLSLLPFVFHFNISFIPSAPWWFYFTAHWLHCRDSHLHDCEINARAPTLPFFPFLFDLKDKAMFQNYASCFARLCKVVTFRRLQCLQLWGAQSRPPRWRKQWLFSLFSH